jgi:hypothetical protein
MSLHLPVLLFRNESEKPSRGETTDISNDGFYCTTNEPFAPGERVRCLIALPALRDTLSNRTALCLDGTAEVVRITADERAAGFGIGCFLSSYRVVSSQPENDWEGMAFGDRGMGT